MVDATKISDSKESTQMSREGSKEHPGTEAFKSKDWRKFGGLEKQKGKGHASWAFFGEDHIRDAHSKLEDMKKAPEKHVKLDSKKPPFKPKPGFPLSKIITNPKDWADAALLVPHEGLRWLYGQLIEVQQELLQKADLLDAATLSWKVKNVLTFADHFWVPILHHHHIAEDYIYFPFINKCAPDERDLPPELTEEHEDLVHQLDRMSNIIHEGANLVETNNHLRAKIFLRTFLMVCVEQAETLIHHCDHEEMLIPEVLRTDCTEHQDALVTKVVAASLGWDGSAVLVPLVLHRMVGWAGDEFTQWFIKNELPLPLRMVYRHSWQPAFQNVVLRLLKSARPGEDLTGDPFPEGVVGYPYGPKSTWPHKTKGHGLSHHVKALTGGVLGSSSHFDDHHT